MIGRAPRRPACRPRARASRAGPCRRRRRVEPLVPDRRLERVGLPELERRGRLHVEVAVGEDRRRGRGTVRGRDLAHDERPLSVQDELGLAAAATNLVDHSAARTTSSACAGSALTDGMRSGSPARRARRVRSRSRRESRLKPRRIWAASASARSFFRPWFSIWRIRSRVTLKARPTSSSVRGCSRRGRSATRARAARGARAVEDRAEAPRSASSPPRSSGSGTESSVRKCPNSDSSSSPTGFSSETGVCALRGAPARPPQGADRARARSRSRSAHGRASRSSALGADDLVQLLDHVHGHPDRARLVGERTGDRLPDPPGRMGRELEALAVVELLRRPHKADRSLLDQVEERQALVAVALGDRDDEPQVRLHHRLLRRVLTALDPLRELDLLRRREQRALPCP